MRVLVFVLLSLLATVPKLSWREGKLMPQPKAGAATALFGDRLILAGGTFWEKGQKHWLSQVDVYEVRTNEWTSGPPLPLPLSYGAFVGSEQGLQVLGGWDGKRLDRQCWLLNPSMVAWTPSGKLPDDRIYGRAEVLDGVLYLLGGSSDAGDLSRTTDTVFAMSMLNTSQWKKCAPMPGGPRALHASTVAAGRLFVFGGSRGVANGDLINLGDAYSYEPRTNRWKQLAPLPQPVRSLSATAVGGRFIYIFGGYIATADETRTKPLDFGFSSSVYVYDLETDRYEKAASLPVPVSDICFFAHGDTLYGAGGEDRNYGRSPRTLIARLSR